PPEGEMLSHAKERVQATLAKLVKKNKRGVIGLVVPEPLASVVQAELAHAHVGDLWKGPTTCGTWEKFAVNGNPLAHRGLEVVPKKADDPASVLPNGVS